MVERKYGLRLTFGAPHTNVLPGRKLEWKLGEYKVVEDVDPPLKIYSASSLYVEAHHHSLDAPLKLDPTFESRVVGDISARIPNSVTPEKEEQISVRVTLFERHSGRRTILPFPE